MICSKSPISYNEKILSGAGVVFLRSLLCLVLLLSAVAVMLAACNSRGPDLYQGYVEADFVNISAPFAGQLQTLHAARGMTVQEKDILFALDPQPEEVAVEEAAHWLARARSRLADIEKGERPTELAALEARLAELRHGRELAQATYNRRQTLFEKQTVSAEELDLARTALQRAEAEEKQAAARLATARLGGRRDAVAATAAEVEAAQQQLAQTRWKLTQKVQAAPIAGLVFDTIYQAGEFVPAGRPVVVLLPPGAIKIRFFVSEEVAASLKNGQPVQVGFDGAEREYPATITYISPEVEYTPPVIFSRETRSKFIIMIEARPRPEDAAVFHPGLPVDVRLEVPHG